MKVGSFLTKSLHILAALTVGLIFIVGFLYNTTVRGFSETVTVEGVGLRGLLPLLYAAIAVVALSCLKKPLETVRETYLFLGCAAVYVAMGLYLIGNVDHSLRADAYLVSHAAEEFLSGAPHLFEKGSYLWQFPHQIGLMLYEALLYLICPLPAIRFVANLGFVIGINFLMYKMADRLFGDRLTNNLTIILSFAFLPQLFFILFAYGNIPGLFFMLFAFYHTLCFVREHRTVSLILAVVGGCVTVLLRKNFIIGVIAIAIYVCLDMLRRFSIKHLILLVSVGISLLLPLKLLPAIFIGETSGMPSVLWLAMGTDIDNTVCGPGWYDGSHYYIFESSDYDPAAAQEKGVEKLQHNIDKITEDPSAAFRFFVNKTASQWSDPLYQSLWTGPMEECGQHTHTPLLQSLYTGGAAETVLSSAMKSFSLAFFGLCLLFLLRYKASYDGWQMGFLTLIGGFLFHLVWEGKSQYIYPYFFSLMPFAALSLARIVTAIQSKIKKTAE